MNNQLKNKLTGWFKSKILLFSPDEEELLALTGDLELEKELNYTFENKVGNKCAVLDFYISDINDENVFKHSIYLEDKEKTSKNGSNLYVNCLGDSQWSHDESTLWADFTHFQDKKWNDSVKKFEVKGILGEKEYHIARVGEYELLSLLKATGRYNPKDVETNLFVDLDQIFDEQFEDLRKEIPIGIPCFSSFVYINENFEQKVFSQFMSLLQYQQLCTNSPDKYNKTSFNNWIKQFDFIAEDSYYNLGKLQPFKEEFLKNVKELNDYDSSY